jgi:hypothetical protein
MVFGKRTNMTFTKMNWQKKLVNIESLQFDPFGPINEAK